MGDMLVSLWSIMANFGFDTGDLANKIGNIIAKDNEGNFTGTLAPIAEFPQAVQCFAPRCRCPRTAAVRWHQSAYFQAEKRDRS